MTKQLNVPWLMGFIDGDGYFGVETVKRKRYGKTDIYYRPILAISQKDPAVLYKIKKFIGCGTVSSKGKQGTQFHYRIRSKKQFESYLKPLFLDYQFQTYKQKQWELLSQWDTITDYKVLDKTCRQARFESYANDYPICESWFTGFFEAEGCFYFNYTVSLRLLFKVTQKNKVLLLKIQHFFGAGSIYQERPNIFRFEISRRQEIQSILVPYLTRTTFLSSKNISRIQWLKVYRLAFTNKSLGCKQKQKLQRLKEKFNK